MAHRCVGLTMCASAFKLQVSGMVSKSWPASPGTQEPRPPGTCCSIAEVLTVSDQGALPQLGEQSNARSRPLAVCGHI